MKLVFTEVVCVWLLLLLLVAGGDGVLGEAALGNYYKEVVREQHEAINEMNQNFTELEKASEKLIDLGYHVAKHTVPPKTIKITNTVAVKVPVPFPVKVPEPVPVPVPVDKPIPIPVPTLVAVPVDASTVGTVASPTAAAVAATSVLSGGGQAAGLAADADVAASSHGPAVPGQDVQEYVQSFPIHSVYDAGDDYNPMEGNRLALAADHNTASPTESTFSNPGPSSLQQYQYQQQQHQHHQHHQQHHYRQYHTTPKGSLPAATAERAKQGSTAHHYRSGVRGSGFTGTGAAAAAAAGQRQQYHAGGEDQTAPAAVAHFGAAESNAIQSAGAAKPYGFQRESGGVGGSTYKHNTPRTPDTPYTFASFYRTAHPSSAPSAPSTVGEGYYRGRQSDGGEFARTGGAGFGEGRGEAGDDGESFITSFRNHHDDDHPGTTEIRFTGGQSTEVRFHGQDQALQAQGEGEGESEGQGQGQEEEEEAARGGQTLGTVAGSVQTPRPFQTVRESYPHYEKPSFGDYHHQYEHHHHHDHGSATSSAGLTGGRGRGEFAGIGGSVGVGIGGGTGEASPSAGSILTEGYDHPSFGRSGGVSGGSVAPAPTSTASATGTHRYPVPGGRSTHLRPSLSTAGHHHTHPHHQEPGQEAHPDLRHQTVHNDHDDHAGTGAVHGGGSHELERFPFYQATKNDPLFARGQLKPYPPQSDAPSGGSTSGGGGAQRQYGSGASKESSTGQQRQQQQHHHHHHHHHHHNKGAASHYHTYTEHHPTGAQYTGAKFDEKYKTSGRYGTGNGISVPSDHHLYPNYDSQSGAQYNDHTSTSGKFQFQYHNVHPSYGTDHSHNGHQQQSNGIGGSGGAASEHHYYHAEPEPTTYGQQLTSYDPPASGGTTYHHFHDAASPDLLPGASEVHEQLAEDAVVPYGEPSPSSSSSSAYTM